MTDETDETEITVEVEPEGEEDGYWVEYSGGGTTNSGQYFFPGGPSEFCRKHDFAMLHLPDKGGDIFGLNAAEDRWMAIGKGKSKTNLTAVK